MSADTKYQNQEEEITISLIRAAFYLYRQEDDHNYFHCPFFSTLLLPSAHLSSSSWLESFPSLPALFSFSLVLHFWRKDPWDIIVCTPLLLPVSFIHSISFSPPLILLNSSTDDGIWWECVWNTERQFHLLLSDTAAPLHCFLPLVKIICGVDVCCWCCNILISFVYDDHSMNELHESCESGTVFRRKEWERSSITWRERERERA